MTPEDALEHLISLENPDGAAQMRAYHKIDRRYLGIANPKINTITTEWRKDMDAEARVATADYLWKTNIYEARLAAAKVLTTARIRPDDTPAWDLIASWTPDFDSWAIADHACMAGQKRLVEDPTRVEAVAAWTTSERMWTRRAALVVTLSWTKQNNPKPRDIEIRDQVLGWAATYVEDPTWFIQKAVAWWVRELSKHDRPRAEAFLEKHGDKMKAFARKEAAKYLPPPEDQASA